MNSEMVGHLQMLVLTAVFDPLFFGLLVVVYILGRVLGRFIPWEGIGKPMVILFSLGIVIKLFFFTWGYDLYFIMGFPFIAGIWGGSVKWRS